MHYGKHLAEAVQKVAREYKITHSRQADLKQYAGFYVPGGGCDVRDFAEHFFFGRGRSVTLAKIGLLDLIKRAASIESIDRSDGFKYQIKNEVRRVRQGNVRLTFRQGYDFDLYHYAMGGGVLEGVFTGQCAVINDNMSRFSGIIDVQYGDIAEDLLSLVEEIYGSSNSPDAPQWVRNLSNLGGTPFRITGSWQEPFSGTVELR